MESDIEVFSSNISRNNNTSENNLYDLLHIIPAEPVTKHKVQKISCEFKPNYGKFYVPKKCNSKAKVKTVRDIRIQFEKDEYEWLNEDLEKQQRGLLKKIRKGQSNNEATIILGKKLLKLDKPVTRDTWQMLMNINPEGHAFPIQFIKWNGKRIKVNGSRGGNIKFIDNLNFNKKIPQRRNVANLVAITPYKKRSLLQQSLVVKFKPGPKRYKSILDNSHQKHIFGNIEIVKLPRIALDITPKPGIVLDPNVKIFLQNLRSSDGQISAKLAEFAVSTVTSKNEVSNQYKTLTFDLNYEYAQKEILMRRDMEYFNFCEDKSGNINTAKYESAVNTNVESEIQVILNNIINAVEIGVNEGEMYTGIDEPREMTPMEKPINNAPLSKEKHKMSKKKYCELSRLDVTVITLNENCETEFNKSCSESFCSLGCVCSSLQFKQNFKLHCGRIDCMFKCSCDNYNYAFDGQIGKKCPELMSGLYNLKSKLNSTMAKEEQKFHQTVIVTENESVLLKSQKRKATLNKSDFDSDATYLEDAQEIKSLAVIVTKINCDNIEPWCMIHNLYKCFCKGRFTMKASVNQDMNAPLYHLKQNELFDCELKEDTKQLDTNSCPVQTNYDSSSSFEEYGDNFCARTRPFQQRKYINSYYVQLNSKIMHMEKNDKSLDQKLCTILGIEKRDIVDDSVTVNEKSLEIPLPEPIETCTEENAVSYFESENIATKKNVNEQENTENNDNNLPIAENVSDAEDKLKPRFNSKLVAWLEYSYNQYKQNMERGKNRIALIPPKSGKLALYPWEFILSRYKEKKNIFLISQQTPFRIFMAVNTRHPLFKKCININDIRFADMHKYPVTVKNLLTNLKDVGDNFCILRGMSHCWELVGSVTKVDNQNNKSLSNDNNSKIISAPSELAEDHEQFCFSDDDDNQIDQTGSDSSEADSSKWFIMTLENDFTEIQFHERGFFVKFESIVKAIQVARASNKTVRLSSKKCINKNSDAQFGIYAIPNSNQYYVFVGPYDKHESLGIKTVNNCNYDVDSVRTRGVWITTKKVDNMKVIDNPLSFMPSANVVSRMLPLQEETYAFSPAVTPKTSSNLINSNNDSEIDNDSDTSNNIPETSDALKSSHDRGAIDIETILKRSIISSETPSCSGAKKIFSNERKLDCSKPIAEIAPQIKITSVQSVADFPPVPSVSRIGGMLILKPEQINERLVSKTPTASNDQDENFDQEINTDIENFLANSTTCLAPNDNIFIVSDDEDDQSGIKDVFIECKSIVGLGWIPGKRNSENKISFEFPGFKFTDFYSEAVVFMKINQVLARKIYVPPHIHLGWKVMESQNDVRSLKLESKDLTPEMVLTKKGLRHKSELIVFRKKKTVETPAVEMTRKTPLVEEMSLDTFNKESEALEEHCETMLSSLMTASTDLRSEIAERLKSIIVNNQDC